MPITVHRNMKNAGKASVRRAQSVLQLGIIYILKKKYIFIKSRVPIKFSLSLFDA
jgi:hypothetical protein